MFNNYLELIPDQVSREMNLIIILGIFKPAALLGLLIGHYILIPIMFAIYRQIMGR